MVMGLPTEAQPVGHASKGESVKSADGKVTLTCVDRRLGFGSGSLFDPDVQSPKSATFSADGKKLYVNSLEGCRTIVYDAATRRKLKTIKHEFTSGAGSLWLDPSVSQSGSFMRLHSFIWFPSRSNEPLNASATF